MNLLLKIIKNYISTGSFLLLSLFTYLMSDSNEYAQKIIEYALPLNGKVLAFVSLLGLVFIYEVTLRNKASAKESHCEIKAHLKCLKATLEKGRLISDVNAAFTEFKASGKECITGEYYIKEIMTLRDTQKRLGINSYTQNKLDFLVSRIKHS